MVLCGRKRVKKSDVNYKISPKSWLQNGKQCKGYILEAAIPLKVFPGFKKKRGMLIGYSITLNNNSGPSMTIAPDSLKPCANIKNFKKAYVELKLDETSSKIKFAAPAKDVCWPASYTKNAGKTGHKFRHLNVPNIFRFTIAYNTNPGMISSTVYLYKNPTPSTIATIMYHPAGDLPSL